MTLIIKDVRLSFLSVFQPHLSEAEKDNNRSPSYKVSFFLDKKDPKDKEKFKEIQKYVHESWKLSQGKKISKSNNLPYSDCDKWLEDTYDDDDPEREKYKNREGKIRVTAKLNESMPAPPFLIRTSEKTFRHLSEEDTHLVYAGAYFDIKVSSYCYTKGDQGVSFNLLGGCFSKHGEKINTGEGATGSDFMDSPIITDQDEKANSEELFNEIDDDEDLPF